MLSLKMLRKLLKTCIQDHSVWSVSLILIGSAAWSLTMVKSGLLYSFGYGYWGPNGHDGIWHIAMAESLSRGTWEMPIFAGNEIQNYHIGFDLLLAWIHKITFIPVQTLYFQILPPLIAISVGLSSYKLILMWCKSKSSSLWSTFFVYFGGSLGWIVTFFRNQTFGGESMFWAQQSISTLINPLFALSLSVMFVGLIYMLKGIEKQNKHHLLTSAILFGLLIQIKVYAGLLILGGLLIAGIFEMVKRRGISIMKVWGGATVLSLVLFLPLNGGSASGIIFKPFWFIETMMAISDRVGWDLYYSAMVNYKLAGNYPKLVASYSVAFAIFIIGNFSLRLFGIGLVAKWIIDIKKTKYMDMIFMSMIIAGILLPLLFVQSGTPWNTIQFMYYSQILLGMVAGISLGKYFEKTFTPVVQSTGVKVAVGAFVIIFTIPTSIATLSYHYLPSRPPAMLHVEEIRALEFLRSQSGGIVLTYPFDSKASEDASYHPPVPLNLYVSNAYVSAFSDKPVFLEDEVNLNITGYDWPGRRNDVETFMQESSISKAREFLDQNNIKYIYWVGDQRALLGEKQLGIEKIFENGSVNIYKVN